MSAPSRKAQVCFDAHRRHKQHDGASPNCMVQGSGTACAQNSVHDARYGRCLVWRPVEGPPLPRRHTACAPPPSLSYHRVLKQQRGVLTPVANNEQVHQVPSNLEHNLRDEEDNGPVRPAGSTPAAHSAVAQRPESDAETPARGQLLPRGKGGIDDVLKNAREAQNLFYRLQERRLKAEYRSMQRELKAELDLQRQYKRMLELAAYQEELVNLYGPSVRDIIEDVFFDDGHDPVLALLKEKREAPLTYRSSAFIHPSSLPGDSNSPRQLWQRNDSAAALSPRTVAESHRDRAGKGRELLHRALEERRSGRRTNY